MSKAEILEELAKLTLAELSGAEWMDDGLITPEEKILIEQRMAEHERDPAAAIPWAMAEEKLKARYGRCVGR